MRLCSHFFIRVLPCVVFLFAAGLFVSGAEPTQARQANPAAAAGAAVNVPAAAVPAPVAPQIDDARNIPGLSPDEIGNLTLPASASDAAPAVGAMPQNRVLPANVGNVNNTRSVNVQGAASDSARARPAYSTNWLVDGVRQLEAESRQRRNPDTRQSGLAGEKTTSGNGNDYNDSNDNTRAGVGANTSASAPASASASATTDNPLAAYLNKWITTPEGAAAIRAGTANASAPADAAPAVPADILLERSNVEANTPWHADTAAARTTSWPAAGNPYIDDMFQPQMETKGLDVVLPPPPIPAAEASKAAQPAQNSNSPAATAPVDPSKLIIKPITPPPTAPVVDEKKYFPQLQRF